jgi:hypothetical protein
VRVALLSLAFLSLVAAGEARGAEAKIVVLHQRGLDAEEELLAESLRIYTRDLGGEVRVDGTAPNSREPAALAQLQSAYAGGAEYVLWVSARDGGDAIYYALDLVSGELRETAIGPSGASSAAQEVALKIRALVSSRRRRSSAAAAPEPARAPVTTAAPDAGENRSSPEVTPADARPGVPQTLSVVAPPEASVVVRPALAEGPRRPPRFALDAGFGVMTPTDRTWARSGLVVDVSGRVTSQRRNASLWIYAEGALSTRPSTSVRGFEVKVADVPVTAGALVRLRLSHGSVALGSRSTLHVFDISAATPDGRAASSRKYGLGLGGLARADATIAAHLGAFLEASVEGIVPNQEFTIGGQSAASTGAVLFGAVAGISLTGP